MLKERFSSFFSAKYLHKVNAIRAILCIFVFCMKKSLIITAAVIVMGSILSGGCKKDNSTTKGTLDGSLKLVMPAYVESGYTKTFSLDTMTVLSRPDGAKIGYYFANPFKEKNDTVITADGKIDKKSYTFEVEDTLGVVSLVFGAVSSDDYYGKSTTTSFTVVKKGLDGRGSITGFRSYDEDILFTDTRDGRTYKAVKAGDLLWMRSNLAWNGSGLPYLRYDVLSDIFGRYYTWEEAQTACPDGWRLPTEADWSALAESCGKEVGADGSINGMAGKVMADIYFNDTRMWEFSRYVKLTDETHLSALPAGYVSLAGDDASFSSMYKYAAFWTSDQNDDKGILRYIYRDSDTVYAGQYDKSSFAASVRCVRSE